MAINNYLNDTDIQNQFINELRDQHRSNVPFKIKEIVRTWRKENPDGDKGTIFEGLSDSDALSIFNEYIGYKADEAGVSIDKMTDEERDDFVENTLRDFTGNIRSQNYWNNLEDVRGWPWERKARREAAYKEAKKNTSYNAKMHGLNDYILNHRKAKEEAAKKAEDDKDSYVVFTYEPGDTFGQKIIDLGIMSENGLWGENGDVAYYQQQLRDGDYLDENGNIRIGEPIKLKKRK